MKGDSKILAYTQDLGGAQCMVPLIEKAAGQYNLFTVVHAFSEDLFKQRKIPYSPLKDFFKSLPPTKEALKQFLLDNKVERIFCSLSSPKHDITNSSLIEVARELNIPSLGFLDHWKSFERFFNKNGEMVYLTDFVGCIDSFCKNEFLKLSVDPERIFIVGQPYLEELISLRVAKREGDKVKILVVSQTELRSGSFKGIFLRKKGTESIINILLKGLESRKDVKVSYRPHPKEMEYENLSTTLKIETERNPRNLFSTYDMFIGYDSMFLVEALLAGKFCVSLRVPEFEGVSDRVFPYDIGIKITNCDEIESALSPTIDKVKNGNTVPPQSKLLNSIEGSIEKALIAFERFVGYEKDITVDAKRGAYEK